MKIVPIMHFAPWIILLLACASERSHGCKCTRLTLQRAQVAGSYREGYEKRELLKAIDSLFVFHCGKTYTK